MSLVRFLNWGLMKDLFVPFREQKMKMQKGRKYIIHAHIDEDSYRIMASAKVEHYLSKRTSRLSAGTGSGYPDMAENRFGI